LLARGVEVVQGIAEALPFADDSFDHARVVPTICFVDAPGAMLAQARRVLRPGGTLVIGFLDRESAFGHRYLAHQAQCVFYREVTFYSAREVEQLPARCRSCYRCLGTDAGALARRDARGRARAAGRGECAFVVVAAHKDS
jgi:ubiquinone/menaquinone biosynthesis C-methylase UbiE